MKQNEAAQMIFEYYSKRCQYGRRNSNSIYYFAVATRHIFKLSDKKSYDRKEINELIDSKLILDYANYLI